MKDSQLKVISWNVNSIKMRLERLLTLLKTHEPDVVCLQELKCTNDLFPNDPIVDLGYQSSVYGQKTYNGVAILSKKPLKNVQIGLNKEDDSARFIGGELPDGTWIYSAYVPNGQEVGSDKYTYKLQFYKNLVAYFSQRNPSKERILIAGDFNVALTDLDVHDPKLWRGSILCSDRERKALNTFLNTGFVDTFRKLHPKEPEYSWWDYRELAFVKNNGLRIDYIFSSTAFENHCKKSEILRNERKGEKPSDHAPVLAEFRF